MQNFETTRNDLRWCPNFYCTVFWKIDASDLSRSNDRRAFFFLRFDMLASALCPNKCSFLSPHRIRKSTSSDFNLDLIARISTFVRAHFQADKETAGFTISIRILDGEFLLVICFPFMEKRTPSAEPNMKIKKWNIQLALKQFHNFELLLKVFGTFVVRKLKYFDDKFSWRQIIFWLTYRYAPRVKTSAKTICHNFELPLYAPGGTESGNSENINNFNSCRFIMHQITRLSM